MRSAVFAVIAFVVGCAYSPTGPTGMTLTISQSKLPVGGTAIVTATVLGDDRALVTFSSASGTFAPRETYASGGIATSTFTATRSGTGEIGAWSGSVSAERLRVSIGELPLPEINTPPPAPTVFLSCHNGGTAGVPAICSVSGSHLQSLTINWGDGSPEQSLSPFTTSVAHVFARAGSYAVVVRGESPAGQIVHASATATITAPPPPPPPVTPPIVAKTSVFMSQEDPAGTAGCAAFNVSAMAATGTRITSIVVNKEDGEQVARFDFTSSGRFARCGLTPNSTILTATATDSDGGIAKYQLIVR